MSGNVITVIIVCFKAYGNRVCEYLQNNNYYPSLSFRIFCSVANRVKPWSSKVDQNLMYLLRKQRSPFIDLSGKKRWNDWIGWLEAMTLCVWYTGRLYCRSYRCSAQPNQMSASTTTAQLSITPPSRSQPGLCSASSPLLHQFIHYSPSSPVPEQAMGH